MKTQLENFAQSALVPTGYAHTKIATDAMEVAGVATMMSGDQIKSATNAIKIKFASRAMTTPPQNAIYHTLELNVGQLLMTQTQ